MVAILVVLIALPVGWLVYTSLTDTSRHFTLAHYKQATAYFPVFIGEAPVREAVLRQIHNRLVDIQPLVSDIVPWKQSADTYYRLFTPERDHLGGIIFDWRDAE